MNLQLWISVMVAWPSNPTHSCIQRMTLHTCAYFQSSNAKCNSQEQQLATRKRPELHKDKPSLCFSKSSSCRWECNYIKSLFQSRFLYSVCRRDGKQPFGEIWVTGGQTYWEWRRGDIWDCTIERFWGSHYTPEQVSAHVLSLISVCIHVYGYCHFKLINPISFHYN